MFPTVHLFAMNRELDFYCPQAKQTHLRLQHLIKSPPVTKVSPFVGRFSYLFSGGVGCTLHAPAYSRVPTYLLLEYFIPCCYLYATNIFSPFVFNFWLGR